MKGQSGASVPAHRLDETRPAAALEGRKPSGEIFGDLRERVLHFIGGAARFMFAWIPSSNASTNSVSIFVIVLKDSSHLLAWAFDS